MKRAFDLRCIHRFPLVCGIKMEAKIELDEQEIKGSFPNEGGVGELVPGDHRVVSLQDSAVMEEVKPVTAGKTVSLDSHGLSRFSG